MILSNNQITNMLFSLADAIWSAPLLSVNTGDRDSRVKVDYCALKEIFKTRFCCMHVTNILAYTFRHFSDPLVGM